MDQKIKEVAGNDGINMMYVGYGNKGGRHNLEEHDLLLRTVRLTINGVGSMLLMKTFSRTIGNETRTVRILTSQRGCTPYRVDYTDRNNIRGATQTAEKTATTTKKQNRRPVELLNKGNLKGC